MGGRRCKSRKQKAVLVQEAVSRLQDTTSFLAGERAALSRAFRETLPSQHTLGALSSSVKQVPARSLADSCSFAHMFM
jgi:hypothetical protein